MPRVYTQNVPRVAGEGYIARLQFTKEEGHDTVLVSAAFLHEDRNLPRHATMEVQTLQRDGTLIDSVALVSNGIGGTQVGLHVLQLKGNRRFQVVVYARGAGVLDGRLTAMHGITTETSSLLKESIDSAGGVVVETVCQTEITVTGGCKVPKPCQKDITPLFARIALCPNYLPGVVLPPDRSCQGGIQVIP